MSFQVVTDAPGTTRTLATGATMKEAVQAWVSAGCPSPIGADNRHGSVTVETVDGEYVAKSLSFKFPDRFAGMTREQQKAAYAAGLRQWSAVEFYTAALTGAEFGV